MAKGRKIQRRLDDRQTAFARQHAGKKGYTRPGSRKQWPK